MSCIPYFILLLFVDTNMADYRLVTGMTLLCCYSMVVTLLYWKNSVIFTRQQRRFVHDNTAVNLSSKAAYNEMAEKNGHSRNDSIHHDDMSAERDITNTSIDRNGKDTYAPTVHKKVTDLILVTRSSVYKVMQRNSRNTVAPSIINSSNTGSNDQNAKNNSSPNEKVLISKYYENKLNQHNNKSIAENKPILNSSVEKERYFENGKRSKDEESELPENKPILHSFIEKARYFDDGKQSENEESELPENKSKFNNSQLIALIYDKILKSESLVDSNSSRHSNTTAMISEYDGEINITALNQIRKLLIKLEIHAAKNLPNEFSFKFVVTPKREICTRNISAVVLIASAVRNWDRRAAIRATWGSVVTDHHWPPDVYVKENISIVFVTALDKNINYDQMLLKENEIFGDILTVNYIDSYRNLTLKSLSILKYASENCLHVPFIIKSDDDVLLDVPYLMETLVTRQQLPPRSMMGLCVYGKPILRNGLWNVPLVAMPYHRYPTYLSGSVYILNSDIVESLYIKSHYVPLIEIEDAYVTGLLGNIIEAKHVCFDDQFTYSGDERPGICHIIKRKKIAYSGFNAYQLLALWQKLYDDYDRCLTKV